MIEPSTPFLHRGARAASLGLARIIVFGTVLFELVVDPIGRLSELPTALFDPPGPLRLLPQSFWEFALSSFVLNGFKVSLVILLILVTLGAVQSRWVLVVTVGGVLFYQALVRGYVSHMNHAELALIYIAVLFVFFPVFDGFALRRSTARQLDAKRPRQKDSTYVAGMLAACVLISMVYVFTASVRIWKGIELFRTPALQAVVVKKGLLTGHFDGSTLILPSIPAAVLGLPVWVFGVVFALVTVLEMAAPLALFSRRVRPLIVSGLFLFHAAAWAIMDARFWENMILLGFFSNVWFHRLAEWLASSSIRRSHAHP